MHGSTLAPPRSMEQRREALNRANEIRTARAQWKVSVKRGDLDPTPTLVDPPSEFETMKVYDALLAMPKVGRVKAQKALNRARVSPAKTLGGMSARQRAEMLTLIRRP